MPKVWVFEPVRDNLYKKALNACDKYNNVQVGKDLPKRLSLLKKRRYLMEAYKDYFFNSEKITIHNFNRLNETKT